VTQSYGPPPSSDNSSGGYPTPRSAPGIRRLTGNDPIVVYSIMGITIIVYLLQLFSQYALGYDLPALYGMKVNELILRGELWRLFTPMLLHGSIMHIGFNMYALFVLGPGLERYYGHGRFLVLYLVAGFAGNVMSFLFSLAPSLGASTAIFGLLGAQGVFLYLNRNIFGATARRALGNVVMIAVVNLLIGAASPMIDNWGHVGGLIGGALFAWFGGPVFTVEGLFPPYKLVDERGTSDALRAGLSVGALFAILVVVMIFLQLS